VFAHTCQQPLPNANMSTHRFIYILLVHEVRHALRELERQGREPEQDFRIVTIDKVTKVVNIAAM